MASAALKDTDNPPDVNGSNHFLITFWELLNSFRNQGSKLAVWDIPQGIYGKTQSITLVKFCTRRWKWAKIAPKRGCKRVPMKTLYALGSSEWRQPYGQPRTTVLCLKPPTPVVCILFFKKVLINYSTRQLQKLLLFDALEKMKILRSTYRWLRPSTRSLQTITSANPFTFSFLSIALTDWMKVNDCSFLIYRHI